MDIAARLAATETYIGITPDQDAGWRTYAQAVIAFAESGARIPEQAPDQVLRLLGPERLARAALERAGKAQAVVDAATALRAELTPEQLKRLLRAEPGAEHRPDPGIRPGQAPPPGPRCAGALSRSRSAFAAPLSPLDSCE